MGGHRKSWLGKIYHYLAHDHERLDAALQPGIRDLKCIDRSAYAEFREGLLRHISIEERSFFHQREPRIGAADVGEQCATSCRPTGHILVAAASTAVGDRGNLCLHCFAV